MGKRGASKKQQNSDEAPGKRKSQFSPQILGFGFALVLSLGLGAGYLSLPSEKSKNSSKSSTPAPTPEEPEVLEDTPEFLALLKVAEALLQSGRYEEGTEELIKAQMANPVSEKPSLILGKFQSQPGASHLQKMAVKRALENLERTLYKELYKQGHLSGSAEALDRLAHLLMLHPPAKDPALAHEDVMLSIKVLKEAAANGAEGGPSGVDGCITFAGKYAKVLKLRKEVTKMIHAGESPSAVARKLVAKPAFDRVDRREGLSFKEYTEDYLNRGRPVILTDYAARIVGDGSKDWDWVKKACGQVNVTLVSYSKEAKYLWAGLSSTSDEVPLESWIDQVTSGSARQDTYLMDFGLQGRCEALLKDISVPKYFAGDLWKRLPFDRENAQDFYNRHPSLFIGAGGSGGTLHVDSHASTFWQLLLKGRKRWTLFALPDAERKALLYAGVEHEILPAYPSGGKEIDVASFPAIAVAEEFKVVAEVGPGELMVVPHDVPHMVENLENVLALSMNVLEPPGVPRAIEDYEARMCFSKSPTLAGNMRLLKGKLPEAKSDPNDVAFSVFSKYGPLP